jgi:hypothetical protein
MHKVWNKANPQKFGKNHVCVSKLVLHYARSLGTHPRIKSYRIVLSWNLSGGIEKNHEKPQSRLTISGSRFEPRTYRMQNSYVRSIGFTLRNPGHIVIPYLTYSLILTSHLRLGLLIGLSLTGFPIKISRSFPKSDTFHAHSIVITDLNMSIFDEGYKLWRSCSTNLFNFL